MSTTFAPPVVSWLHDDDPDTPLVVLFHGRGSSESEIIGVASLLPPTASYVAVRAPITEGGGYAWFANRGIGRPIPESLAEVITWFRAWLDDVAPPSRPVILVGFSGGAAFAGGVILDDPKRFEGAAILFGTLPFDAGVPTTPGRLTGATILVIHGDEDRVIPADLLTATWNYLTEEAGATTTAARDPGGHGLSQGSIALVRRWLDAQLTEA
jgi:phospholipase/carboxylesterase